MDDIANFFNHPFFFIIGGITTLFMLGGFIVTVYLVIKGVFPVWYRLGIGLSKRRIAIFSSAEYNSLRRMLIDSKIFESENILQINKNDIRSAENETLFLVHWKDFQDKMDEILQAKKDSTALIVYAPQNEGRIDSVDMLEKINSHRNTVIVNFRGRLLNDIVSSLITTSYDR